MEFLIRKDEFLKGLQLAQGIADRKSSMPILANVLLRTDGKGKLLCGATDLAISVTTDVAARVEIEGGLTLDAKKLYEIVRALPGAELSVRRGDNNHAELRAGKVSYRLVGLPDRDFPKLPDHREVSCATVEAKTLRTLIGRTLYSVSTDETRYHLNGALFESDGDVAKMASTDGHRLSFAEEPLVGGPALPAGVIIPRKGLLELKRVLDALEGSCELGFHGGHAFLRAGGTAVAMKLVEAQFPPYDQVIPKSHSKLATLSRPAFIDALKRTLLMASEKTSGVKLTLEAERLVLEGDHPDQGQAREELDIRLEGEPLTIGFNARYLLDVLGEMDSSEVRLELSGELDPGVLRPAECRGYLGVVMPMRILAMECGSPTGPPSAIAAAPRAASVPLMDPADSALP
jgi:DNA polymerase-3 subunit beta